MFCWQARRRLGDLCSPYRTQEVPASLRDHLDRCESCRLIQIDQDWITVLVRDTGQIPGFLSTTVMNERFEESILEEIHSRAALSQGDHEADPETPQFVIRRPWLVGFQLSAACSVLLLVGFVSSIAIDTGQTPPQELPATAENSMIPGPNTPVQQASGAALEPDRIAPPPEIRFTIYQDLMGVRHGRIPAITYVLEPPPKENAVLRAAF